MKKILVALSLAFMCSCGPDAIAPEVAAQTVDSGRVTEVQNQRSSVEQTGPVVQQSEPNSECYSAECVGPGSPDKRDTLIDIIEFLDVEQD